MKYKNKQIKEINGEELLANDYLSISSLKSAVWQYIIDHATPKADKLRITTYLRNEEDFWWRVKCRQNGSFSRTDLLKLNDKIEKETKKQIVIDKYIQNLINQDNFKKESDRKYSLIEQDGTLLQKVLLKVATFINKIARSIRKYALV